MDLITKEKNMNKTITLLIIVLLGGCSYGKRLDALEANQNILAQQTGAITQRVYAEEIKIAKEKNCRINLETKECVK